MTIMMMIPLHKIFQCASKTPPSRLVKKKARTLFEQPERRWECNVQKPSSDSAARDRGKLCGGARGLAVARAKRLVRILPTDHDRDRKTHTGERFVCSIVSSVLRISLFPKRGANGVTTVLVGGQPLIYDDDGTLTPRVTHTTPVTQIDFSQQ